jgi:hypothetical protein
VVLGKVLYMEVDRNDFGGSGSRVLRKSFDARTCTGQHHEPLV